ncbi:hypothetical protein BVC80_1181g7 [Macleaya cordata]|uniref:Helicase MAGATAMA 3 n=1 Tax=Macleaya cordata TaxID=56857 RepID=A0A200PQA7_MACCD|nr:hypothetical protein BVC80_1181g7 [Macleaya cordata]
MWLQVQTIPKTFSSVEHYLNSYRYPLLEEIHAELFSSMTNLSQSPICRVFSVKEDRNYKSPENLFYKMIFDDKYHPLYNDIIAFSDVRAACVKDLNRPQRSYVMAIVLGVVKRGKGNIVHILASKPIVAEQGEQKKIGPLFAIFLINIIPNLRIWEALHGGNLNIIKEVLNADSQDCGICSQVVECIPGKDLHEDLLSFNLNESQLDAVLSSIRTSACNHKSSVKLIWGPPGTGKTKTVGTLLWALLKLKCKTLTCAPTNTAAVEVTSRLMWIVREKLQHGSYGLGDIVLFGNKDRMKIDDHDNLLDVFLDYRIERLRKCFTLITKWGSWLGSMKLLLKESYQQYLLYLVNRKNNIEKIGFFAKIEQMEGLEDETLGITLTIGQFIKKRLSCIEKHMSFCIQCICTHMPTSFISAKLVENMHRALDLLKLLITLLHNGTFTDEQLKQIFSDSETIECTVSDSSTLLLSKTRKECLEILSSLAKFSFPKFRKQGSIRNFCLRNACLIFCTTSSSVKLYGIKKTKLLIIDEAAQLKECESAIPLQLPDVQHAILIGDERQLPAMVQSKISEEAELGRSLFERLVTLEHKRHLLNVQYRMHPSISLFPNTEFYSKQISDAPNVKERSYTRDFLQGNIYGPYSFIDVSYGKEEFNKNHSRKNMVEVAVISEIIENLSQASVASSQKVSVGVISPYNAQVIALTEKLGDKYGKHSNFSVSVRSVDGFQGGEEDVIIMSTVRSNGNGSLGFLSKHQRTNVALTRARYCLWIVGDGQALIKSDTIWKKLVLDAKDRGCYYNADDDKKLSKAIIDVLVELDQFDDLLNMNSLLFKGARWKVIFGDGFWKSLIRIKNVETRKEVVALLMKLSSGWRHRPRKQSLKLMEGTSSSQMLEQNKINGLLNLIWTTEILKENSKYIQVLKFLDILPSMEIPRLAKSLDVIFRSYTVEKRNRCKFKCLEGTLEVPMSWETDQDIQETDYEELSTALASLHLGKEHNTGKPGGSR